MPLKRVILEMGTGNDLHGGDYTKAAVRVDIESRQVEVIIGVQQPDKVDKDAVLATLPHGQVTVKAVKGGIDIPDEAGGDFAIIANAAIQVRLDLP